MSWATLGTLVALALLDSSSFGTLLVPLLLVLAARRVAWPAIAVYLGSVMIFYFLVGVALLLGLDAILSVAGEIADNRALRWVELGLGVALFGVSFRIDGRRGDESRRSRLGGVAPRPRAMVALALSATVIELATMVPYLAAIGLIARADAPMPLGLTILLGYCVVMILPATVILLVASVFGDRLWSRLQRFGDWMERQTAGALGWIVGIVGFFIAADAVSFLFGDDKAGAVPAGLIGLLVSA